MASPVVHQMNADECIKRLGQFLLSESQGGKTPNRSYSDNAQTPQHLNTARAIRTRG